MIVIWLEIYFIIDKLCVINRNVIFFLCCNFNNKLIIWVWIEIFNVEIGLFVIINFGLMVNVWVILICWCCLFENLWG